MLGASPERVADEALAALASPQQGAELARLELDRHAELFERRYEITFGEGPR